MTKEAKDEQDILNLSDEDFANLSEPTVPETPEQDDDSVTEEEVDTKPDESDSTATEESEEEDAPEASDDEESDEQDSPESEDESGDSSDSESFSEEDTEKDDKEEKSVNYEKVYEEIFGKSFKANGREMQVRTTEEVIQLMQMGANYNKKMAAIKQQLPYLKMLEKNNLLDEKELSFLIDLKEKKPEAIAKLLQDSEIDLYDFDTEQLSNGYAPTNRAVSPKEIEVEEVLASIADSPQYTRTVTTLGTEWDETSRDKLVNQPHLIKAINEHMESGLFDTIQTEVDRLRVLGKLNGVSDLDAYDQVGAMIFGQPQGQQPQAPVPQQQPNNLGLYTQQQHQQELARRKQEELQKKKKAAASNVRKSPKQSMNAIDILNLSDEEFENLGNPNFI